MFQTIIAESIVYLQMHHISTWDEYGNVEYSSQFLHIATPTQKCLRWKCAYIWSVKGMALFIFEYI